MKKLIMITALLLCSLSWISVSGYETVEVQSGEGATLTCSNMSRTDGVTFWFRVNQTNKPACISVMINSKSSVNFCDGFQKWNFEMRTNISTVSLTIKQVNSSDSGLYFCGFFESGMFTFCVKRLNVKDSDEPDDDMKNDDNCSGEPHEDAENKCDGTTKLMSGLLGGLTVVLVNVIIGLAVKVRKCQTAANAEHNQHEYENDCDVLKDAALSTMRNRKPASEREVETRVVYAARR